MNKFIRYDSQANFNYPTLYMEYKTAYIKSVKTFTETKLNIKDILFKILKLLLSFQSSISNSF